MGFDPNEPRDKSGKWTGTGYHGTASKFDELKPSAPKKPTGGNDMHGIYFTDSPERAYDYGSFAKRKGITDGSKPRVIAAELHMENPLDITNTIKSLRKKGMNFNEAKQAALKKVTEQHDGVIFRGNSMNTAEYIIRSAKQAKIK